MSTQEQWIPHYLESDGTGYEQPTPGVLHSYRSQLQIWESENTNDTWSRPFVRIVDIPLEERPQLTEADIDTLPDACVLEAVSNEAVMATLLPCAQDALAARRLDLAIMQGAYKVGVPDVANAGLRARLARAAHDRHAAAVQRAILALKTEAEARIADAEELAKSREWERFTSENRECVVAEVIMNKPYAEWLSNEDESVVQYVIDVIRQTRLETAANGQEISDFALYAEFRKAAEKGTERNKITGREAKTADPRDEKVVQIIDAMLMVEENKSKRTGKLPDSLRHLPV